MTQKRAEFRKSRQAYDTEWNSHTGVLKVHGISDFDPAQTFECGQCFRWEREPDGSYTGTAGGRTVNLQMRDGILRMENVTEEDFDDFWFDYLDFGGDYGAVKTILSEKDPVMRRAVEFGSGIRLLHQDPWETVISFIISQNSNIRRISRCIDSLCAEFGEPLGVCRGKMRFSFPDPCRLAVLEPEDLAVCRLGYRDKYVIETARAVAADGGRSLAALREADYGEALCSVRKFCGVGPKVADCVLLFGLLKYESFPLDVWMKRIMSRLYGFELRDTKGMSEHAARHFGNLSGFAQQYLFYYARENL